MLDAAALLPATAKT